MEAQAAEQTHTAESVQIDKNTEQSTSQANTVEDVVTQVVNNAMETTEVMEEKKLTKKPSKVSITNSDSKSKNIMKIDAKHAKKAAEVEEDEDQEEVEQDHESEDSQEEDDDEESKKEELEEESEQGEIRISSKSSKLSDNKMKEIASVAAKTMAKEVSVAEKIKKAEKSLKEASAKSKIKEESGKRKRSSSEEPKSSASKKQKTEDGAIKKSTRKIVKAEEPMKERPAKLKADKTNKAIAKSGTRTKSTSNLKKMEIQSRAKASKGVPDAKAATKKPKKSNRLSAKDAHIKYRTRLGLIPDEEFEVLDGAWISIYEPSIRNRKKFDEGFFPLKWTQILRDVAAEKGATIMGCLPHYGKTIQGTELKAYTCKPEIVDKDKEDEYHEAGYKNIHALRVYVGKKNGAGREEESQFAMLADDHKADELWYAIKDVLDGDSEDEE